MTSQIIKSLIVAYYRFVRRMNLCCTEFNNEADVLCTSVGGARWDEIEVKISWADFLRDFKKPKHERYLSGKPVDEGRVWERMLTPHYFWFAAPKDLAEKICMYLNEHREIPYGVYSITMDENNIGCGKVYVMRPAKRLHKRIVDWSEYDVAARMSSDYAKILMHYAGTELKKEGIK